MFGDKASGGKFLRIEGEGDVNFAIVGEEEVGNAVWDGYERKYVAAADGKFRFGVNVYANGEISILEGNWYMYQEIAELIKEHGVHSILVLTKEGEGQDTRYSTKFLRLLKQDEIEKIAKLEALDIKKCCSWTKRPPEGGTSQSGDDDIPF